MKKILLSSLFLVGFLSGISQTLEIREATGTAGTLVNGTTITVSGVQSASELSKILYVTNTGNSAMTVGMVRYEESTTSGTFNTYCWGVCPMRQAAGAQTTWDFNNPVTINAGAEEGSFDSKYYPENLSFTDTLLFVWYNTANRNDSTWVRMVIDTKTASVDEIGKDVNLSIYPNPANSFVNFEISGIANTSETEIQIVDMLGSVVSKVNYNQLVSNGNKLDVSNLPKGVYFASVKTKNKVLTTKKLVITE